MATQLPIIFRENDSLDDFLDRMLLRAYQRKQTGSHSKAARLLRTDTSAVHARARIDLSFRGRSLLCLEGQSLINQASSPVMGLLASSNLG